jgi:hypothetical protein
MRRIVYLLLVCALPCPAFGQGIITPDINGPNPVFPARMFQYAAKFVCGIAPPPPASPMVAASGRYFTAINVHNPSRSASAVVYKKFTVGKPAEQVGPITQYFEMSLRGDETMQVECEDIARHLGQTPTAFLEGYAVIESAKQLDVVAVYTAGSGSAADVTSIHTERVQGRGMAACTDLNLSVNTGYPTLPLANPWVLVAAPTASGSVPRAPNVPNPTSIPWPVPFLGSLWISGTPTGSTSGFPANTVWEYETCFCVCPGAQNMKLTLTGVRVDDEASFFLNNVAIGNVSSQNPPPAQWNAVSTNATPRFRPGRNCLRVRVVDTIVGFSGLDVAGAITGAGAACQ